MNLEQLKEKLPDYAKDTKLNLSIVLGESGSPGLNGKLILGLALAVAYSTKNKTLIAVLEEEAKAQLPVEEIRGARAAAVIMAMNNIYYRTLHLVHDQDYTKMPARLRMNIIGTPGIEKINFEAYSLAVSVINGCGQCIDAHSQVLLEHGLSKEGVQSIFRIAAVLNAVSQAIEIEQIF